MKTVYLITLFLGFSMICRAQNYPIGHRTITYLDVARGNHPIPSELYYPATSAGESTPLATGMFPVIVFGHGFQMAYDSYAYFKNASGIYFAEIRSLQESRVVKIVKN